jgi:hypothetical protein
MTITVTIFQYANWSIQAATASGVGTSTKLTPHGSGHVSRLRAIRPSCATCRRPRTNRGSGIALIRLVKFAPLAELRPYSPSLRRSSTSPDRRVPSLPFKVGHGPAKCRTLSWRCPSRPPTPGLATTRQRGLAGHRASNISGGTRNCTAESPPRRPVRARSSPRPARLDHGPTRSPTVAAASAVPAGRVGRQRGAT